MIPSATAPPATATILVVEDEPGIVDFLERGLHSHGFVVRSALDGIRGTELALEDDVDLVVLDLMLPGRHGLSLLDEVRERRPTLPVIVLTASDTVADRVAGLEAGAIDYIGKPFSLAELVARIRAQLRVAAQSPETTLVGGTIQLDLLARSVHREGELVRLSATEFELLAYLMSQRDRVLSREQILRGVWGYEYDPGTNVVDVYIGYLRRKLRSRTGSVPIATVRSVGYRFDS